LWIHSPGSGVTCVESKRTTMSMVGRNILGLQPVGECLLAKISALCVFCIMFIPLVYLIISEICIYNVHVCWLFVCAWHLFTSLCCSMDLDLCMRVFHA
jgi:hypothetical protein